jgi:hypothetical protein
MRQEGDETEDEVGGFVQREKNGRGTFIRLYMCSRSAEVIESSFE